MQKIVTLLMAAGLFLPVVSVPDPKQYQVVAPLGRYLNLDEGDYIQIFCAGKLTFTPENGVLFCEGR